MRARSAAQVHGLVAILLSSSLFAAQEAKIVEAEGRVVVTKTGRQPAPATVGIGLASRDKLGTGESSRAVLKMTEKWFARIDEETDVEITPGAFSAKDQDALKIALGGAFIFSREQEGELKVQTPSATGGLRGTQLVVRVYPNGRTFLQVLEGEVDLANEFGQVLLRQGEAGEAEVGAAPRKTAVIEAQNLLQWALYYPAVLLPEELELDDAERRALSDSLEHFRQGDLLGALDTIPPGFTPSTASGRLYRATTMLATGQVTRAREVIEPVPAENRGKQALLRMIAAVQRTPAPAAVAMVTASEALAESYFAQSRHDLEAARVAAQRATELQPGSGFAWIRCAELEFGFGRVPQASAALNKGLSLAPRHAQGHALRGFLLAAENRLAAAREAFTRAIAIDGGLGTAWLGLGLVKIRQGQHAEGRSDLQVAATLEPNRAFFYSYHGKALDRDGFSALARKDLALAKALDPQDPTPWLYSALQLLRDNRPVAALGELEESIRLNDNRQVYRSAFLLDQDLAVRSANLARVYQQNGMSQVAIREATRAVESDYTNASAHLFLANSFDALRDPSRITLRHETAWFNEQLLAGLLLPVGAGPLSQFVSLHEYSKLLTSDGIGGVLATEWREAGYVDHIASLSGSFGRFAGGLDFAYHRDGGNRPNQDHRRREAYWQFKYELSPSDTVYTLGKWERSDGGDLARTYDNRPRNAGLRFRDEQAPGLLLLGWNHRWQPGVHTLFVGARLSGDQQLTAPGTTQTLLERDASALRGAVLPPAGRTPSGALDLSVEFQRAVAPFLGVAPVTATFNDRFDFVTSRDLEILSGELQHLWQTTRNLLLVGTRWQRGDFTTSTRLDLLTPANVPYFTDPAARQEIATDFERVSFYAYNFLAVTPWLTLLAGVAADRLDHPENFRNPPVSARQRERERVSGKVGFTLAPSRLVTVRGLYAESLGGVTFDESVRLEPVQLAGFNQAFRTIISESIVGSVEAPVYRQTGLSVEGTLPSRTWYDLSANVLKEDVRRTVGAFDIFQAPIFPAGVGVLPASTTERLDYRETKWTAGVHQLVGAHFAVAARIQSTRAELRTRAPQVPLAIDRFADRRNDATLREATLIAHWNAPSGWFAAAEAAWLEQKLDARVAGQAFATPPGDEFFQLSAHVGRKFARNRREISGGVLNLSDQDYRLNPLTHVRELPRSRTFFVRYRVSF